MAIFIFLACEGLAPRDYLSIEKVPEYTGFYVGVVGGGGEGKGAVAHQNCCTCTAYYAVAQMATQRATRSTLSSSTNFSSQFMSL